MTHVSLVVATPQTVPRARSAALLPAAARPGARSAGAPGRGGLGLRPDDGVGVGIRTPRAGARPSLAAQLLPGLALVAELRQHEPQREVQRTAHEQAGE